VPNSKGILLGILKVAYGTWFIIGKREDSQIDLKQEAKKSIYGNFTLNLSDAIIDSMRNEDPSSDDDYSTDRTSAEIREYEGARVGRWR
jgi:hypothetical protein